jgi:predicted kinase
MKYVIIIGVGLSGKTTYREANFTNHEVIALSYSGNNQN